MNKQLFIFICLSTLLINSVFAINFSNVQSSICHVTEQNEAVKKCKNGEVMLFAPSFFGNEYRPILISAAFCDFEYPIVYNKAGVSCIFTNTRKESWSRLGMENKK